MKYYSIVVACMTMLLAGRAMSETGETANHDNLDTLIGYYSLPSPLCSSQNIGDCEKSMDCLQIHKTNSTQYHVQLYSIQANLHLCAFEVVMKPDKNTLRYQDKTGREIFLTIDNTKLLLHTNGFRPSPGFCGAQAAIDGLAFPRASRQPEGQTCFKDE